jgi:hypothetical protein
MAKSSTTFNEESQPSRRRGRSNRTIILEMMKEQSMLDLDESSTKEQCEKAFFKEVATSAFDPEDSNRGMCLTLLANKGWSNVKPSNEMVEFDFDINAEPHMQAAQVMKAASEGCIAPDIASSFISSIKAMVDIEEYTDLKARIEKLEAVLNGDKSE